MEIGSPEIENPEDYYDALNAILEINPTSPNGDERYALSLYDAYDPELYSGFWGLKDGYEIEDKRYIQIGFKAEDAETAYLSPKNNLGSTCTIAT